jgi:hypothetical protein
MENRKGFVAAAEATLTTGTAQRDATAALSERLLEGATVGAEAFIEASASVP